jgi:hypothetical protein
VDTGHEEVEASAIVGKAIAALDDRSYLERQMRQWTVRVKGIGRACVTGNGLRLGKRRG